MIRGREEQCVGLVDSHSILVAGPSNGITVVI
jgi:hypothetical protein